MELFEERLDYMPYKSEKYLAIFMIMVLELPICVLSMMLLHFQGVAGIKYVMIPNLGILLIAMIFLKSSQLKITFTTKALYTQNGKNQKNVEHRYRDYPFAYYCKNYRGQVYLILSECELERKRVKRIVSYGGNFGRTFYDSCIVVLIDQSNKQINIVKKYIVENIKNVYVIE